MHKGRRITNIFSESSLILVALIYLSPFYFVLVNSFKTLKELMIDAASFPQSVYLENFRLSWITLDLPDALKNSILITFFGVIGLVLISSMAAYRMSRMPDRINKVLFLLFVSAMTIPFQALMIPLMKVVSWLDMVNSLPGIIICYLGLGVSFTMFLYHGFIGSIPREIEESANVDGCSPYGVYWRIVFPLLKPMSITVIILQSLWIWNDFLLPLIIIPNKDLHTIQLAINSLFGQYTKQWDIALAALTLGIIPLIVFFLALQRHVIGGITAGAVKG